MVKKLLFPLFGLLAGIALGVAINYLTPTVNQGQEITKQSIGFLPYWLLDKASTDYSDYITTLTYFGLNVDGDGHIIKLKNPQEEDPGWHALSSGKLDPFLTSAQKNNLKLSLLIDSNDSSGISQLISKPSEHAKTLVQDVEPLMKRFHFSDLNLYIEYTATSSAAQQKQFTQFVQAVKKQIDNHHLGTLTIEISPKDLIQPNIIDLPTVATFVDTIVLMAYDYHSTESIVTGPIAPLDGAGVTAEYDVKTAVEKALEIVPHDKLILGAPLYGYEWETLNNAVRSAIIPGTGAIASNKRMESFLVSCATCSAFFETESQEEYTVFHDQATGTYHQAYFPTTASMQAKIDLANKEQLGGIALWALGYEGGTILTPLTNYKVNAAKKMD